MIITIDGPAGSGKSTVARKLAQRLSIAYLDTGAMYRAVAYQVIKENAENADHAAMATIARRTRLSLGCGPEIARVLVNGRDVSGEIRTLEVSRVTSAVASVQSIRDLLVEQQHAIGASLGSFVSEGRDQGSVVFPDADVKFILEASDRRRAERRLEDMCSAGESVSFDEVLEHVRQRDAADEHQWEPLLAPGAAIRIDTTAMTIDEVVDTLADHVRTRTAET